MPNRRWITAWRLLKSGDMKELLKRSLSLFLTFKQRREVIDYPQWRQKQVDLDEKERQHIKDRISSLPDQICFTFLVDARNCNSADLLKTIESVLFQLYPNWLLWIMNDAPLKTEIEERILELQDNRIAITDLSSPEIGDWIIELPVGTQLSEDALSAHAFLIADNPTAKVVYSDHDHINPSGEFCDPYMKPGWNFDLFIAMNYLGPLIAFKRDIWEKHKNNRSDLHDFLLRNIKNVSYEQIFHIPKILTSLQITGDGKHLEPACRRVFQSVPEPEPLVSILIPTRDKGRLLEKCLQSLFEKTLYSNFEVVLIDHETSEKKALKVIESFENKENFKIINFSGSFNFSAMINSAVKSADGQIFVLLNNDTQVVESSWLTELVAQVSRQEVGVVGALLLFADGTIQHAGVHPDPEGFMTHGHKHWPGESVGYFSRLLAVHEVAAVTGACLAVRRDTWDMLGGLDEENLPVAYNDIDLCLKARREGLKVIFTPYARLLHHESISRGTDNKPSNNVRLQSELSIMRARWGDTLNDDPAYNPNLGFDRGGFNLKTSF